MDVGQIRTIIEAFDSEDGVNETMYGLACDLITSQLGHAAGSRFANLIDATDNGFYSAEGVDVYKLVLAAALEDRGAELLTDNDGQLVLYMGCDKTGKEYEV
jgi:hypothetical protein